jgi:hypothetical protein
MNSSVYRAGVQIYPHLATISEKEWTTISTPVVSNTAAFLTRGSGKAGCLAVMRFASCLLYMTHFERMARMLFLPFRIQNSRKRLKSPCSPTWHDFTGVLNTSLSTVG